MSEHKTERCFLCEVFGVAQSWQRSWSRAVPQPWQRRLRLCRLTCADKDPEFSKSMTTANIARDMDRIRAALGEEKISFLGNSWGTALGATYRTLFDGHVDRMLLDSVMMPGQPVDRRDDEIAARETLFHDFAAWIARYDGTYQVPWWSRRCWH
jgi:pimeloyl-ACP methyl ester carboxylesterase